MNNNVADANADGKSGFFSRIKTGLSKTRSKLAAGFGRVLLGEKAIDSSVLEEIETILLTSDVGVAATQEIVASLTQKIKRNELANAQALFETLQLEMTNLLLPVARPLVVPEQEGPFVILMVGVNGAGKTTTIGKLAKRFQAQGKSVLLAAGDTYRAAAVEQLKVWGERNNVPVIAQATGADSASVIFDALEAAKSRGIDVLIADTAGRLQSKKNLMEELAKIRRVMSRLDPKAPHEVMLVLDATTGQNAISQAQEFRSVVNVSGIAITKLDGTAKGGVVFAIAQQLAIPIRFIGVGETMDDLRPFEAEHFVRAIFAKDDDNE